MTQPLWNHQSAAIELARREPHVALAHGVGTGKSRTMIEILREEYVKRSGIRPTLIFSPLSVCAQWKKQFSNWSEISPDRILVLTGDGKKRQKTLEQMLDRGIPCIVITNYEAVRIKCFYDALLKWSPDILVADEAQKLKDPDSKQSKAMYPLAHAASRRFTLTGTPILNSMLDIFGQYKVLDPSIFGGNLWKFKTLYFYDKNAGMPSHVHFPDWMPREGAAQLIGGKISRVTVQANKEDCLDLPPLLKVPVKVELSPGQAKSYREMEKQFVTEVGGTVVTAEFAMTKTLRLQQILAGFAPNDEAENKSIWWSDVPRLEVLRELLDQIGGKKTIIWTTFRPTYRKIEEVCKAAGYVPEFLTGDQSAKQKEDAIERFCRGESTALIANPSAGGAGINLQEASFSIYYTRGYSLEHYLQSEGRNHRGGSDIHDKITHFHLVAEGTLDEVIARALMSKKQVGDEVLSWARHLTSTSGSDTVTSKETEVCQIVT